MNGVLNVDKPGGITSHDVVDAVRRITGQRRVGHTGTLDPMATGVLPICIGKATRLSEAIMAGTKDYIAGITFGVETDTQDSTGRILSEEDASYLTKEAVQKALEDFLGAIQQTPPMVSARRYHGRRLYELAREGISIPREARLVRILHLELLEFHPGEHPSAVISVTCSGGTYIRTLVHDVGAVLGCGAHMSSLRRTRVACFTQEAARKLDEIERLALSGQLDAVLIPMTQAVSHLPSVTLNQQEAGRVKHGQPPREWAGEVPDDAQRVALIGPEGALLAIARVEKAPSKDGVVLKPYTVLVE